MKKITVKARKTWGKMKPVTRVVPSKKIYKRSAFKLDLRMKRTMND